MRTPIPIVNPPDNYADSFWNRVDRSPVGCWEWKGGTTSHGYGNVQFDGRQFRAHRLAYALANGDAETGLLICHTCDNRKCCRPSHLVPGSHLDNMRDMAERKRSVGWKYVPIRRGEQNNKTKLTTAQVMEIRERREQGIILEELAQDYCVSISAIHSIITRKSWGHI